MSADKTEMTQETTLKVCPQCDGAGQEEIRAIPCVCRKCKGAGTVQAMTKVAMILDGGLSFEKHAEDMMEEEEDGNEMKGPGIDPLVLIPTNRDDRELKAGISSVLESMSPANILASYNLMNKLMGQSEAIANKAIADSNGGLDEEKALDLIYAAVDKMNNQQLRDLFCAIRNI